jgi:hypothetical protein
MLHNMRLVKRLVADAKQINAGTLERALQYDVEDAVSNVRKELMEGLKAEFEKAYPGWESARPYRTVRRRISYS